MRGVRARRKEPSTAILLAGGYADDWLHARPAGELKHEAAQRMRRPQGAVLACKSAVTAGPVTPDSPAGMRLHVHAMS